MTKASFYLFMAGYCVGFASAVLALRPLARAFGV